LRNLCEERLIKGLDSDDNILHLRLCVLLVEDFKDLVSVCKAVCIAPARVLKPLTAVVESVLALWCAVQVDDDFESSLARPSDGLVEAGCSTLGERTPWLDVRPVTNRDTNEVEAGIADLLEVLEGDEVVPVRLEGIIAALFAELLAESPFVVDRVLRIAMRLKDRRGNEPLWRVSI